MNGIRFLTGLDLALGQELPPAPVLNLIPAQWMLVVSFKEREEYEMLW